MAHLAVVVPVLSDSDALRTLLVDLRAEPTVEIVVVDGGHDRSIEQALAGLPHARVIRTAPGRASQMNAGAAATTAGLVLFLHADSRLPRGWYESLLQLPRDTAGGWFRFGLDDRAWQARLLEVMVGWRVRLFRLPYGDQGMFVRREIFDRLGGFRTWPLMEDVDFVRRLVRAGSTVEIPLRLRTSSRRWRRDGWVRRSARNVALTGLYLAGVPPERLARWYEVR